jgi:enoyl-CoA hydratase
MGLVGPASKGIALRLPHVVMEMIVDDTVIVECSESVLWMTLNRPERGNSLTPEMLEKIEEALQKEVDNCRVAVLTGTGDRHFCGGFDLALLGGMLRNGNESALDDNPFERAVRALCGFPRPVLAMLNGHAVGGGLELAVSCDLRIAATGVRCLMPPARLGLLYSPSGLNKFVDLIGISCTKELFYTARPVPDEKAVRMGLVDHLIPREGLFSFTRGMARTIAENAPLSVSGTKWILEALRRQGALDTRQRDQCNRMRIQCFLSEDFREGQSAFVEKREPVFKGK